VSQDLKVRLWRECDFDAPTPSTACHDLINEMSSAIGHVNLYNVYGECITGRTRSTATGQLTHKVPIDSSGLGAPRLAVAADAAMAVELDAGGPDACIDSIAGSIYFNQPAVLEAAHVKKQPFEWSTCGNQIRYSSTRPNLPRDTYPELVKHLRVLIYNGDWDSCVPYTDGAAWTEGMGYKVADPFHPWLYKNGTQVAGYATRYEPNNFTFITVKGGRHEVPETAPWQALEMLRRLLSGENF